MEYKIGEYEVGDKVRTISYSLPGMDESWSKFLDKVVTIVEVNKDCYKIKEDGQNHWWNEAMILYKVGKEESMKYKVGDKVRIIDKRNSLMNCQGKMDCWLGKIMTIEKVYDEDRCYRMKEDGQLWFWYEGMIVGKVEEEKHSSDYYLMKYLSAKLSEKEAELNTKLSEIKKIQEEIKKVLDNES